MAAHRRLAHSIGAVDDGKDVPGTFAARDGGEDRHRRGLLSFSCLYAALAPVMAYERATVK